MIPEISKAMRKAVEAYHKSLEQDDIDASSFPLQIIVKELAVVDDCTHYGYAPISEYSYNECDYRLDKK